MSAMCTEDRRCDRCPARPIAAGPRALAQALPALGLVVSATTNHAAVLSHTGEYLPPALPGDLLRCDDRGIGIRLGTGPIEQVLAVPRAITLCDSAGTHRAYLTPLSDPMVTAALAVAPAEPFAAAPVTDWTALDWRAADQITHLDALTPQRYRVLPFTGARRVDPRVVPQLLAHLTTLKLPYTLAVPGGGCVQLHRGHAEDVEFGGGRCAVVYGAARLSVDMASVAECWLTSGLGAAGPTTAVELYDREHRCAAVLTQTGPVCSHLYQAWETITASLPETV